MCAKRVILHVDVNSAFLSWEALDLLEHGASLDIRTVPSVVGGDETSRRGIVLAKSTPAKAYDIQTGETLFSARRKCRDLLVVPSHYPLYAKQSNRLYALLCEYSPVIQRYSIDECFLDFTGMEYVHGDAVTCAEEIRRRCETELGFTVNVGVGPNKVLAKMAGELRKPNFVNTLFPDELAGKLWPLPVRELFMVGRQTERALARRGVHTIGELARMDPQIVRYDLKSHGMLVWGYANGIDPSPVVPNDTVGPKSYSNAATLPTDAHTAAHAHTALRPLCESVTERMRRDGWATKLLGVQIKYADFSVVQRQRALRDAICDSRTVFEHICTLFDELWDGRPVRLLGARLGDLCEPDCEQLTLEDSRRQISRNALDRVADNIRAKYGRTSLMPATMLRQDFSHLDRYAPNSEKPKTNSPF